MVVQFTQTDSTNIDELGGIPFRGGTTILAGTDGQIRYIISKPLPSPKLDAEIQKIGHFRLQQQIQYLTNIDKSDPKMAYGDENYKKHRSQLRMQFSSLHQGVIS